MSLKSIEEIKKAIKEYLELPIEEFAAKYGLTTGDQAIGFIKGLRWILKLP